jgi:hypothetical protein
MPRFNETFATFARMWSAGMVPIFEKSGGWPGFRYNAEEQAAGAGSRARLHTSA